jgi:hypothetical protein
MWSPPYALAFILAISCTACAASHPVPAQGTIPQRDIQDVVRSVFDHYRACYQDGLGRNPRLQGRVTIYFVIATDGSVAQVEDRGSDLPDRGVIACIADNFRLLRFPKPNGGIVRVVYPIIFNPGKGSPDR